MERFRRYAAAFMLTVFVTSSVGSWTHQAKAQIPGLSDLVAGFVKGIGENIFGTAADAAQLALILEEVTGMKESILKKTQDALSFLDTIRSGFYVMNSLRIIDSYSRDVSQFVSNLITGNFYNLRTAIYSAQSAITEVKYIADCVSDMRSLLAKSHGSEGESTSKQTVIMTVHQKLVDSYKSFLRLKNSVEYEDRQLAKQEFYKAMFYRQTFDNSDAFKQWYAVNGPKYDFS